MKNLYQILLLIVIPFFSMKVSAQMKIGINPTQIDPNSNLEVQSQSGSILSITKDSSKLGLGTSTPKAKLDIIGNVKISDGTQGVGKIFTSDANGFGFWSSSISPSTILSENLTNSNGVIVTGGAGAVLKAASLRIDSSAIAKMIVQSPVKDSIGNAMTNLINNGSVVGKNTTAGSLMTVTNGTGASLTNMNVSVDTISMKTFISKTVTSSPTKDSLIKTISNTQSFRDSITNIINTTSKDLTNGNGVIVTGGTGTTLKATSLRIDSMAIAKMVVQSPVKDSILIALKSQTPLKVVTSSYTITTLDFDVVYNGIASATFTLPAASTCKDKIVHIINHAYALGYDVSLSVSVKYAGTTSTSVDEMFVGGGFYTSNTVSSITIQSDGNDWWFVGR